MNLTKKPEAEPLSPSDLWLALTALPRPWRELPVPRKKKDSDEPVGYVRVWPLTQEEQMAANAEADRFTKTLLKDPQKKDEANLGYHHTFTNEVAIQVLSRACRDVNDINRPAFPSPNLMRGMFTTDEIGVLFAGYCTIQGEIGPIRSEMSKEETEALIFKLVEGGSAHPFDSCTWDQQRTLVSFMASQVVRCWTAISSVGLPLDVSSFARSKLSEKPSEMDSAEDVRQESDAVAVAVEAPVANGEEKEE